MRPPVTLAPGRPSAPAREGPRPPRPRSGRSARRRWPPRGTADGWRRTDDGVRFGEELPGRCRARRREPRGRGAPASCGEGPRAAARTVAPVANPSSTTITTRPRDRRAEAGRPGSASSRAWASAISERVTSSRYAGSTPSAETIDPFSHWPPSAVTAPIASSGWPGAPSFRATSTSISASRRRGDLRGHDDAPARNPEDERLARPVRRKRFREEAAGVLDGHGSGGRESKTTSRGHMAHLHGPPSLHVARRRGGGHEAPESVAGHSR